MFHSNYLSEPFNPTARRIAVLQAVEYIKANYPDVDAIAVRGVSGTTFGTLVAYELNKQLIVVRKRTDNNHGTYHVESSQSPNTYLVVDDFVSSGATLYTIKYHVDTQFPQAKCLGMYCYKYVREALQPYGKVQEVEGLYAKFLKGCPETARLIREKSE